MHGSQLKKYSGVCGGKLHVISSKLVSEEWLLAESPPLDKQRLTLIKCLNIVRTLAFAVTTDNSQSLR